MADSNVTANPGVGGSKFKVDDDGVQVWPYSKLAWGTSGTQNEVDDAAGKRVPVKLAEVGSVVVPVQESGRGTVFHGQTAIPTTVGGTALAANACKSVVVKNLQSNAAIIWVGVTGVTAGTGYELNPGESLTLQVSNSNLIYALSASGTQNLCFIGTN
jgi:hypothetical protein